MSQNWETVLCQSCSAINSSEASVCAECGAALPGVLMEREERQAKAKLIESLPEAVRQKVLELEAQYEKRPDAVAVCLQLSNLYKDLKLKDFAVEYLEKAIALDPENKFLQQKLQLLIVNRPPDKARVIRIEKQQSQTARYTRYIGIGAAAIATLLVALLAKGLFFSSVFCLAPVEDGRETIKPKFSSDGTMIAYLDQPRFTLFGMVDQLTGQKPKGETWLMVKPLKGDAERVTKISAGRAFSIDFAWRPKHNELTFISWHFKDAKKSPFVIYSVPASGGEPKALVEGRDFAWSRDGDFLAYVKTNWSLREENGLYLLNIASGLENKISSLDCSNPSWSPTDNELVYQAKQPWHFRFLIDGKVGADYIKNAEKAQRRYLFAGDIYRYDFIAGTNTRLTETDGFRHPKYTPDGQRITALTYAEGGEGGNNLTIMDRDGGNQQVLLAPGEGYEMFGAYSWSPRGNMLAFEGFFEPQATSTGSKPPAMPPGMSGFVPGNKNYVSDIFVVEADGSGLQRLKSSRHQYKKNPVFSPNGKLIAFEVMYMDFRREIWAMKP